MSHVWLLWPSLLLRQEKDSLLAMAKGENEENDKILCNKQQTSGSKLSLYSKTELGQQGKKKEAEAKHKAKQSAREKQ